MSRFSDLFQNNQPKEELFSPASVVESVEVSEAKETITELSKPEAVSEEVEIFSPETEEAKPRRKTRRKS